MTAKYSFAILVLLCLIFSPEFNTRRYKRHDQKGLSAISSQYAYITWAYWLGAIVVVPLVFGTILGSWILGATYPKYASTCLIMGFIGGMSFAPIYQAIFALLTGVYPINKFGDYVVTERPRIVKLAVREIAFILSVVIALSLLLIVIANINQR